MTDPNAMTEDERTAVLAAIHADQPVRMVQPGGRIVTVIGRDRVAERLAAGYRLADTDEQPG
jgi:hypothetical protein